MSGINEEPLSPLTHKDVASSEIFKGCLIWILPDLDLPVKQDVNASFVPGFST